MSHKIIVEIIKEKDNDIVTETITPLYIEMSNRYSADMFYTTLELNDYDLGGFPDGVITKTYNKQQIKIFIQRYKYLKTEPYLSIQSIEKEKMAEEQMLLKIDSVLEEKNIDREMILIKEVDSADNIDMNIESLKEENKDKFVVYKIKTPLEKAKQELDTFFESLGEKAVDGELFIVKIL